MREADDEQHQQGLDPRATRIHVWHRNTNMTIETSSLCVASIAVTYLVSSGIEFVTRFGTCNVKRVLAART